jgi:AraC family transcriptional regulator, positive regulator of tynA and feaB
MSACPFGHILRRQRAVGQVTGRTRRTFSADVTASGTARDGFEAFRREWDTQVGEAWPLAGLDIAGSSSFRINVQAVKAHDVVIADVYSESYVGRTTANREANDKVLMHLMRRGAWRFGRLDERGETVTVPAGSFIVRHNGPPSLFEVDRGAAGKVLILPASVLGPLIGDRQIVGSAGSAEMRLLMAHAGVVTETVHDLTPGGVQGARDALLELAKGVLRREFDDAEPRLAPALARAAMEIADDRLGDSGLSPATLARELNVSVRTLHRAFTTVEESVAAYIRRRRLERARLELAAPLGRPDVSEVAARWQFADSSHFIRAFKKQYGETPAQFARSASDRTQGPASKGTSTGL